MVDCVTVDKVFVLRSKAKLAAKTYGVCSGEYDDFMHDAYDRGNWLHGVGLVCITAGLVLRNISRVAPVFAGAAAVLWGGGCASRWRADYWFWQSEKTWPKCGEFNAIANACDGMCVRLLSGESPELLDQWVDEHTVKFEKLIEDKKHHDRVLEYEWIARHAIGEWMAKAKAEHNFMLQRCIE